MNQIDAYIFLFNDSFLTSLMFIPRVSYALDAMWILGNYNPYLLAIIHFIACMIGAIVNWVIGSLIRNIEKNEKFVHRADSLMTAEIFFEHYGKWVLLATAIPFWGALFTTAAGVLRFNIGYFLILVAISRVIGLMVIMLF